jgi:nucleoside phosphorylase
MAIPVLPPSDMSVEEKLQTMATIWESLSANPEAIESPAWPEEELRVRETRVASGEAKFVDWEKAKEEIRRQTL